MHSPGEGGIYPSNPPWLYQIQMTPRLDLSECTVDHVFCWSIEEGNLIGDNLLDGRIEALSVYRVTAIQ